MTTPAEDAWTEVRKRFKAIPMAEALGLSYQALWLWKVVPKKRLAAVAKYTGIPLADLRPDLYATKEPAPENKDETNG